MTPIPALDRTSASFKTDVDTFFGSQIPTFVTEANALQTDVTTKQGTASTAATTATTQAGIATTQAGIATTKAGEALASANAAAVSAASAASAPGTNASSTTSLAVGTGSKSLTIETGKLYSLGQTVIIANTATPTNQMSGVITAFNSGTGALTVNVTAIGGSGTFTAWTISLSGVQGAAGSSGGGATETTSAVDITLTSSSNQIQVVTMTASGKNIILPDATTLTAQASVFAISLPLPSLPVSIRDAALNLLTTVSAGQTCYLSPVNVSTAAGKWIPNKLAFAATSPNASTLAIADNSGICLFTQTVALTETSGMVFDVRSDGVIVARCFEVVRGQIVYGSVSTFATGITHQISAVALTATKILVYVGNSSTPIGSLYVIDVTRDPVTPTSSTWSIGSPVTLANSGYAGVLCANSATQAVIVYWNSSSGATWTNIINVSGTVPTVGNSANLLTPSSAQGRYNKLVKLATDKFLWTLSETSASATVITISGTTISGGSRYTLLASGALETLTFAIDSTKVLAITYNNNTSQRELRLLTISGTVVTPGSATNIAAGTTYGMTGGGGIIQRTSSLYSIITSPASGGVYTHQPLIYESGVFTAGSVALITGASNSLLSVAPMLENNFVASLKEPTNGYTAMYNYEYGVAI